MASLEPIPAIDIRGGRCVRLLHGDFDAETVYGDDPVEVARRWERAGATRIHVVDLDGARDGVRANAEVVRNVLGAVTVPVQVGGGIRAIEVAEELLADGADRVVLGTAAVEAMDQLKGWVEQLGSEHVIVGVDARDGKVATRGWLETTDLEAVDFVRELGQRGVERILFTDIGRDGTLHGPNLEALRALIASTKLRVIASGGVSSAADIIALAHVGAEAAIIGKALYDGRLHLSEALAAAREAE